MDFGDEDVLNHAQVAHLHHVITTDIATVPLAHVPVTQDGGETAAVEHAALVGPVLTVRYLA